MKRKSFSGLVAATILVAVAAGCGVSGGDPQSLMTKAQQHREKRDHKAAIIELKNVLQKDADHGEARYLLGLSYFDTRDYRSAEQELRRALEAKYDAGKVLPMLGKTWLILGEFQKVLDQVPVDENASNAMQADVLTVRARALLGLRQADKAKAALDQALAKQPEFADVLLILAQFAAVERRADEAARLLDRAIANAPKNTDAWLMKGDLARLAEDEAGMRAANEKVLEIDPTNVGARLNLALMHAVGGKFDEARKMVAQARSHAPGMVAVMHMQALVEYRAGDLKAANDAIQQVLKVAPTYPPSMMLAGAILSDLGSYEQAQTHLSGVLERAPNNLAARKLLVSTLAKSGQLQRALEVLQPALAQVPQDAQLLSLAGELYLQSGDNRKAGEFFDKATARDPKNALARSKLGLTRMASGDTERAFADLESAVALDESKHQTDMVLIVSHLRRGNFDQALKAMASLEKKQPNNPVTYNLKAVIYMGKQDLVNARKNFERALELQPTFMAAAMNLAQLDLRDKNPKAARARLEAIAGKDTKNVQALVALAELGPALGATQKEQVEWLERARKANPQAPQPQLMLAQYYLQTGEPKKALEVAQQAQAANPDSPQFLDLLGSAQMGAGEKEQSLVTYRKMVKLQPKNAVAHYRLANALGNAGEAGAAEESLKQALALNPTFTEAMIAMVPLHLRAKRYAEAMGIAQQVQKQQPKAAAGHILEGNVLMAEQKFPQAIKAYETAQSLGKNAGILVRLHAAYVAAGKPDEGDARLAQWLKESPDDATVRVYAGETAIKRGKHKEAATHYEWLLQKQGDSVLALNNLAWAYHQLKDARAVETAERAYKLAPDNASVGDTLGMLLIAKGDVKRGIEILEKATKAAPNVADIHFHLAQGWAKSGEKSKARGALERALAINDKFPEHAEALAMLKQLRE